MTSKRSIILGNQIFEIRPTFPSIQINPSNKLNKAAHVVHRFISVSPRFSRVSVSNEDESGMFPFLCGVPVLYEVSNSNLIFSITEASQ